MYLGEGECLAALGERQCEPRVLRLALRFRGGSQERLFALARAKREEFFPAREVEVRSVIEVSNTCKQRCNFCNIGGIPTDQHYVIGLKEALALTDYLYDRGRRVVMLQSGEWPAPEFLGHVERCVAQIKERYPDLELILCLGSYSKEQYRSLRAAGAERYILKFECSNPALYSALKPRDTLARRLACLETLLELGFKVGSGNMVGFPGQRLDDLANDLLLLGQYPLCMASTSVFIPGEQSVLAGHPRGDLNLTLNMIALMRILYPTRLIPTTSALERVRPEGQYLGLMAGANTVTIHDGTPPHLKQFFPIYSVLRFTPTTAHLQQITSRAGLRFAPGPLAPRTLSPAANHNAHANPNRYRSGAA